MDDDWRTLGSEDAADLARLRDIRAMRGFYKAKYDRADAALGEIYRALIELYAGGTDDTPFEDRVGKILYHYYQVPGSESGELSDDI